MARLEDKVAVVTGGAGRCIGGAISKLLAREGASVAIADSDDEGGRAIAQTIVDDGGSSLFCKADVTHEQDVDEMVTAVVRRYGRIDILVNNVGGSTGTTLDEVSGDVLDLNLALNLKSAIFCTKAALPFMVEQGRGSVVYVSSINALLGGFSEVAYASAKAGLHSLVQTLTADYSRLGIRFNVVCPGSVLDNSATWAARELASPGILSRLEKLYPLGRTGNPIDVAYAIAFLASDEAAWITGVILPVDGGLTATGNLPGHKWWESLG